MDVTQIQTLLGLASGAVGLTGQAAATVEAVKKAFAGGPKSDDGEAQQLLNSLATQLTSVNMMNVQLSMALKDISAAIEDEDRFEKRLARYKLIDGGMGEMIYTLRDDRIDGDPSHYICPICLEKERQFHFVTGGKGESGKHCQGCRHYFSFGKATYSPR